MIPDRHTHKGSGGDGERINIRDILDADRFLFIPATAFEDTDANVAIGQLTSFGVLTFTDGATGISTTSFMIPQNKKSIASIKLLYYNVNASTNLLLTFNMEMARLGRADRLDTTASTTYATSSVATAMASITVPKTTWDSLFQLNPFDVIGFQLTRTGGSASDTYDNDLSVFGLLVEFG